MGEVKVEIELENTLDRGMALRGLLPDDQVRSFKVRVLADTGAVMLVLPQDEVEALGLPEVRKAVVKYADERTEERSVAGAGRGGVGGGGCPGGWIDGAPIRAGPCWP